MGWLNGQRAALVSRATVREFNNRMAGREARITIIDPWGGQNA